MKISLEVFYTEITKNERDYHSFCDHVTWAADSDFKMIFKKIDAEFITIHLRETTQDFLCGAQFVFKQKNKKIVLQYSFYQERKTKNGTQEKGGSISKKS